MKVFAKLRDWYPRKVASLVTDAQNLRDDFSQV